MVDTVELWIVGISNQIGTLDHFGPYTYEEAQDFVNRWKPKFAGRSYNVWADKLTKDESFIAADYELENS